MNANPRAALTGLLVWPLLAIALLAGKSYAGSNQRTGAGIPLRWPSMPQATFVINPGGVPGFTGELEQFIVAGAIRDAFRAWTEVPNAVVAFTDGGLTTQTVGDSNDGISLVSFQDTTFSFSPGTLAVTRISFFTSGTIVDADILFNPQLPNNGFFSPVGATGSTDLVAVAVHEIGHLLGLGHSGIFSAIMNPFARGGVGVIGRAIQSDDAALVAALYPAATFGPSTGTIAGTVTNSSGSPVRSAHVVAISDPAGIPVASQLSGAAGEYSIQGLPPGNYRILVEPLDGPINLGNFSNFYSAGQNNFTTTLLGGLSSPTTLPLGAGQTVAANVALPPTPSSNLNISLVAVIAGGAGLFTGGPLYLPRGNPHLLAAVEATGANDTAMTFSMPGIVRTGSTIAGQLSGGTPVRLQNVSIDSVAPLGPSTLMLSNNNGATVLPGGVVVTVNPQIASAREIAGLGTAISPGSIISISGTDLAERVVVASAFPLPTQMGGVSVRIGSRLAPLFLVSPTRIIAMVPYEVSGAASIQVITGPGTGGNSVALGLSATAPGIFSANPNGTGQGAIVNLDGTLAAPAGAGRPAVRGDSVRIFASGLGPVSPALPSGLQAGAGGSTVPTLVNPPTVRIGGQLAVVTSAALAAGYAGFYVVTAQVPAGAPTGSAVPVQITTFEGQSSNTVTMAVAP